ncbi:MAG: Na/Pi symporter [Pirellulaceae bacterium]
MNVMGDATAPLRDYPPFIDAVRHLDNPIKGVLLSAALTAIVQSSSATTVLIIMLAQQGLLSLEQAIPLVYGANVGTCVTALLAAIGKSTDAMRAAWVHVTFNVAGVLLWFGFTTQLAEIVRWMSSDESRQIANAHTVFNVGNTLVFIWFTGPLARFVTWLVPERPVVQSEAATPKYLDEILLQTPGLAIDSVRRELGRLGTASLLMVRAGLGAALTGGRDDFERLERLDDDVDSLHAAIVSYIARLSQQSLSATQTKQLQRWLLASNYFENIGDLIETQLMGAGRQRAAARLVVSPQTQELLEAIHHEVTWSLEHAVRALVDTDAEAATQVADAKATVNRLVSQAEEHLSKRLTAQAPQRLVAYRLESEIMEYLKRVYYFAKRVSRLALPESEEEAASPS